MERVLDPVVPSTEASAKRGEQRAMRIPFDVVSCSWPRPVRQENGRWLSEPEWDTPLMPVQPQPYWEMVDGEPHWTIDWRKFFKTGIKPYHPSISGEMRGFHVVFRLRAKESGKLAFRAEDGCMVRLNGGAINDDSDASSATQGEVEVRPGDLLQVAQRQRAEEWVWAARMIRPGPTAESAPLGLLLPYLPTVRGRLGSLEGPPLKMYTSGRTPLRAIVALYSTILNGYAPSEVLLFGEHQWSHRSRELFAAALPFARFVPTERFLGHLKEVGGPQLAEMAKRHWFVMKALIALLYPPQESFILDDDVFILERLDEALEAFEWCELVFQADADWGGAYLENWGWVDSELRSLPTGALNAGLYWIRNTPDPAQIASVCLASQPNTAAPWKWEQGLIAILYARRNVYQLPTQRYLYPLWSGLPGGMLGYDYANNPCGFVSIHFGALLEKPSDSVTLRLAPDILARMPQQQICPY